MTTIKMNAQSAKTTRAQAIQYAIENLVDCPQDIMDVLVKIEKSFTKKPSTTGESKTAKENKVLAQAMTQYVIDHFDPEDLEATNAKSISNTVSGITTTQKVTAVAKYAESIKAIKVKGRTFYVPEDVEVTE